MVTVETLKNLSSKLKSVSVEQDANAAVTVILTTTEADFQVLLVKRAVNVRDAWSGQMALPGGKREPTDVTLQATAIRETQEETGVRLRAGQFLGVLEAVEPRTRRGFRVVPFVAALDTEPEVHLNSGELHSYMWVSLEKIRASRGKTAVPHVGEVPAFLLQNEVVWGMTYKILQTITEKMDEIRVR
ncbi:MAG: CoA pyrophosphatase [Candidatus Bathyarchaeia archaeon]|jgi:8-oxo-dGTP pyrophosphatase MutT (NUDIX family)